MLVRGGVIAQDRRSGSGFRGMGGGRGGVVGGGVGIVGRCVGWGECGGQREDDLLGYRMSNATNENELTSSVLRVPPPLR
jgi:hypothetical protein